MKLSEIAVLYSNMNAVIMKGALEVKTFANSCHNGWRDEQLKEILVVAFAEVIKPFAHSDL